MGSFCAGWSFSANCLFSPMFSFSAGFPFRAKCLKQKLWLHTYKQLLVAAKNVYSLWNLISSLHVARYVYHRPPNISAGNRVIILGGVVIRIYTLWYSQVYCNQDIHIIIYISYTYYIIYILWYSKQCYNQNIHILI